MAFSFRQAIITEFSFTTSYKIIKQSPSIITRQVSRLTWFVNSLSKLLLCVFSFASNQNKIYNSTCGRVSPHSIVQKKAQNRDNNLSITVNQKSNELHVADVGTTGRHLLSPLTHVASRISIVSLK